MTNTDIENAGANAATVISKILDVAELVASVTPVGASVVSAIKLATMIGNGLVSAEPAAVAVYEEIDAMAKGGIKSTPDQWATWNKAADDAHAALQAAAAAG